MLYTPFLECSLYVHLAKSKVDRRFEVGEGVLFSACPYSAIHSELKCTNILILKSLILLHCSVAYYTGGKRGKLESAFNVREKRKFGNQSTPSQWNQYRSKIPRRVFARNKNSQSQSIWGKLSTNHTTMLLTQIASNTWSIMI